MVNRRTLGAAPPLPDAYGPPARRRQLALRPHAFILRAP